MKTVALFGGSFDPPHLGHVRIVEEALKIADVEKVVIMPTFLNPFKAGSHASSELRLKWIRGIFQDMPNVEVSSFEVDLQKSVPSIQSVLYLLKKYQKVYLIIGADNLQSLHKWERYEELDSLVTFVVATRGKVQIPENFLQLPVEEKISSTELRKTLDGSKLSQIYMDEILEFYKEKN